LHVGQEQDGGDERQLAAELGISDRVRFFGSVLDISPILRAADVFLMPSTHEGFGVAACEAMGAGLPVILSDVPGLRDMRAFGPIQWIEPTVSGVSEALLYFCHMSEADRNAIGRQLSESVHCYLGLGAGAARYAAIYLDNGAPSSPSIEVEEQLPGWSGY
jgi:glycosyltransferase involved in cell wall biosynthesis